MIDRRLSVIVCCMMITLFFASSCGRLGFTPAGRTTRLAHDFQQKLTFADYAGASTLCDPSATWVPHGGAAVPIVDLFDELKKVPSKRAFFFYVNRTRTVSGTRVIQTCELRQQFQIGLVDIGNYGWDAEILWEKSASGKWRIIQVRDTGKWIETRSK